MGNNGAKCVADVSGWDPGLQAVADATKVEFWWPLELSKPETRTGLPGRPWLISSPRQPTWPASAWPGLLGLTSNGEGPGPWLFSHASQALRDDRNGLVLCLLRGCRVFRQLIDALIGRNDLEEVIQGTVADPVQLFPERRTTLSHGLERYLW